MRRPNTAGGKSEPKGIGLLRERSLHKALREWLTQPGDLHEVRVDGYVVDLVRGGQCIEIQTRNFFAIKHKLKKLLAKHPLRLVFPIAAEKWIVKINPQDETILSRRKSPKRGHPLDIFGELIRIPDLINHENFTLQVLMIQEEEIRQADGRGSWRRGGVSIVNRKLLCVAESFAFHNREDFKKLLPGDLAEPFTNKDLANRLGIPTYQSRRMTYCLSKMGVLDLLGRQGNCKIFQIDKTAWQPVDV